MSVVQYGRQFPVLLRMSNPRGHVELLETIGKGNYGYVYKGKLLKKNNQLAAIKVVFLKEDEIRETLLEMEILEACSHPNITAYLGCFLKGLDLWICMEYCGAGSVDTIYRTLKCPVPEIVISSILYESILALEYLHTKAALIHRDIKAGNLLLTLDGKVKLADFGVSAQLDTVGGGARTFIGTPYWMAPEVIACDPDSPNSARAPKYNHKSDIWSIGITGIEIAEKNPPLSDIHPMQALHLIAKSDIGFSKPKSFSKPFVDFIMYCLNKNPSKRPSASDCLNHPFMEMAANLEREKILTEIVTIVQKIKDMKKKGEEVTEQDEARLFADGALNGEFQKEALSGGSALTIGTLTKNMFGLKGSASSNSQPSGPVVAPTLAIPASDIKDGEQTLVSSPAFADFPPVINHVSEGTNPVFEPIALTSIFSEYCTADFLDGQYILIGCEKGLFYLDITKPNQKTPIPIIHDIRFCQLQILHDLNVLIALSGRHSHIRQYSLSSIRKLILYVEGNSATLVENSNTTIPIQQVVLGKKANGNQDPEYRQLHQNEDLFSKDETNLISNWTNDFIKIPDTRDSKSFCVELTESSAFISTILFQGITIFRWAQAPYEKFMKIKSFWVPETPQFVSFSQDGLSPTDLYIGYTGELNRVTISDSQVKELPVHKEMKNKGMKKPRWQCIRQIPFANSKLEEILRQSSKSGTIIGARKNAALAMGGPTLARPSHAQVNERYFLATYERLTKVVDHKAHPMIGAGVGGWKDGVMWSEPPITLILRPLQNVISVGKTNIEMVEWKSALLRQRLSLNDSSASFKILADRHGYTLIGVEKKKRGVMIYWMRENSPPPRPPGELLKRILADGMPKPEVSQKLRPEVPENPRPEITQNPNLEITHNPQLEIPQIHSFRSHEFSANEAPTNPKENLNEKIANMTIDSTSSYESSWQDIYSPTDSDENVNSFSEPNNLLTNSASSQNYVNTLDPTERSLNQEQNSIIYQNQPFNSIRPDGYSTIVPPLANRPPQSIGVPHSSSSNPPSQRSSFQPNISTYYYLDQQARAQLQPRPSIHRPPTDHRISIQGQLRPQIQYRPNIQRAQMDPRMSSQERPRPQIQTRPTIQRPISDPRINQGHPGQIYVMDPQYQQVPPMYRPVRPMGRPPPPGSSTAQSNFFPQSNPGRIIYQKGPDGVLYGHQVSHAQVGPVDQQYQPAPMRPVLVRAPSQYVRHSHGPRPPFQNQNQGQAEQEHLYQYFNNYEDPSKE